MNSRCFTAETGPGCDPLPFPALFVHVNRACLYGLTFFLSCVQWLTNMSSNSRLWLAKSGSCSDSSSLCPPNQDQNPAETKHRLFNFGAEWSSKVCGQTLKMWSSARDRLYFSHDFQRRYGTSETLEYLLDFKLPLTDEIMLAYSNKLPISSIPVTG